MNYTGSYGPLTIIMGMKGEQCPPVNEEGLDIYEIPLDDASKDGSTTSTNFDIPDCVWVYNKDTTSLQDVYRRHDNEVYQPFVDRCRTALSIKLGMDPPWEPGMPVPWKLRAIKFCDGEAQALKNKTDMTDDEEAVYVKQMVGK